MVSYCNPMLAKRKREMDASAIYVNRVSHIFDEKRNSNHVEKEEGEKKSHENQKTERDFE